jgi:hypothetical protein
MNIAPQLPKLLFQRLSAYVARRMLRDHYVYRPKAKADKILGLELSPGAVRTKYDTLEQYFTNPLSGEG